MRITHEKLKILNALQGGPQMHKVLRMAYYGEERCKNPSNTSFYNQLQRMMEDELIQKTAIGFYSITDIGREELAKEYQGRRDLAKKILGVDQTK